VRPRPRAGSLVGGGRSQGVTGRVSTPRGITRGLAFTALVVGVALVAGPSSADVGLNVLSIDDVTVLEGNLGPTNADFTVTLTPADPDDTITVEYTTSSGTAELGSDYTVTTGVLTFLPNETEKTISVPVLGDTTDEINETFQLDLFGAVNADIAFGEAGLGTGTITDDDAPPAASISNGVPSPTTEGGTTTFTVTLSAASGQDATVNYSLVNGTTTAGDFTGTTSGSVTFAPGDTSEPVAVATMDDAIDESNEEFSVLLSGTSTATAAAGQDTGAATIADDDPTPTISLDDDSVTEGGNATFTVTLSNPSSTEVTVDYATTHGSTSAADFTGPLSGTVTFAPGDTSEQVTLATFQDAIDEPNETYTVALSNASLNASIGDGLGAGSITDDDNPPTISINDDSVGEGGSALFTVSLSNPSSTAVAVDYATTHGSTSAADFTGSLSGTVTFAPGDTSEQVTLATFQDAIDEPNETYTVALANASLNASIGDGLGAGSITDDDLTPTVAISDATGTEGDSLTFNVTLSAPSSTDVTATYAASADPGTADSGDLTAPLTGTVTFPANTNSTQQVTVATTEDASDEPNETFTVTLSALSSNATFTDSSATGTIADDDPPPAISIVDASTGEGGNGVFAVTLSNPSASQVTVDYATTHGSTSAADFTTPAQLAGTVTFAPGDTSESITLATVGDTIDEPNETFTVSLANASLNASILDGSGAGTIVDDDAPPTISIGDATATEGGNAVFTVSLSNPSSTQVTVDYSTTHGSTSPSDFANLAQLSGTVTFAPGDTSEQITIATLEDTTDEPDESFVVSLANASLNASILDGSGAGTIDDDDNAPAISINDASTAEGGNAAFTVSLSNASSTQVTVDYATTHGSTSPADFTTPAQLSGTVTFAAGDTTEQITLGTFEDTIDELNETFTVALSSASPNASILDGAGAGTIVDDDAAPTISIGDVAPNEGENGVFIVSLSNASSTQVTVNYATTHGSTSPADFTGSLSGTVTFPAGSTAQAITIATAEDTIDEPDETFTVSLSNASLNATIGDGLGAGTIVDDDAPPIISINDATVTEGGSVVFTVSLSNPSSTGVTVDYATTHGSTSAADFTGSLGGTVTFAPGDTSESITLATFQDTIDEPNETFTVSLSNASLNASIGDGLGAGSITDNDNPPTISIADASATEGGSVVFTVSLSNPSSTQVSVDYAATHGTTSAADFTGSLGGTIAFAPGDTSEPITIATFQDAIDEPNETFTVSLSNASLNASIGDGLGAGSITDNDNPPTISIADASAAEGGSVAFTVSLSNASSTEVTVDYATTHGTTNAADFTGSLNGTVTFVPGDTSEQVTVATVDDSIDEPNETFTVSLSNASLNASIGDGLGAGSITDNDNPPTISIGDATPNEGENAVFTVLLSNPSSTQVTVDYATTHGTTSAADFTGSLGGTVTFAPGDTSEPITLATLEDTVDEPDESFSVTLSNASLNASILDGSGAGTIVDDDAQPTISINDATVAEGGSAAFTVSLSNPSSTQVTVDYATTHGTTSAADFTGSLSGTVTFAPGDGSEPVSLATFQDTIDEPNETFTVVLANASPNASILDGNGAGAITDNDNPPTISIADASAAEGGSVAFTVSLSNPSSTQVTVDYATTHGTTSAADFTGSLAGTISFAPGDTSEPITLTTFEDAIDEPNETFTVALSNASPNASILDGSGAGTIVDDDAAPTISVGDATPSEGDNAVFTVSLSNPSSTAVTVDFSTTHGSTAPADFTTPSQQSGTVTFPAGSTVQQVTIATFEDASDEPNETFTVSLANASLNASILDGSGAGTIVDDDAPPTISIGDATATEGGNAVYTVSLSNPSSAQVTVDYATTHGSTSPSDFANPAQLSGTVTFAPGDTSEQITIATLEDTTDEPDETFVVSLANASLNASILDGSGAGTIVDDDNAPTISINDASTAEGGNAVFTVSLSNASSTSVTVDYATTHGSTSAADFTGSPVGTVTFAPGDTSEPIALATFQDTTDEPNETFTVSLSNPSPNASIGDGSGAGSITDNDNPPTISIADASAAEGGTVQLAVTLSQASGHTVTVDYATANGSAGGADYTPASGTLTFLPGQVSHTVDVAALEDTLDENDETFTVTLSLPVNATIADGSATGTIVDNDAPPTVSIGDAAAVTEGANATFTVSLSAVSGRTVTVNYATANGSAVAPGDYDAVAGGSVTFNAGELSKPIPISTNEDVVDEADGETFSITLSAPVNATLGTPSTGTGGINDNDASPQLSIANAGAVIEGALSNFTVTLSAASEQTVTVDYATGNGTATTSDYTAESGTLTFTPGVTSRTLDVQTLDDPFDEPSESFVVTLSTPVNAAILDGSGSGSITDNDNPPTISIADASAAEGGTVQLAVTLSQASGHTVTVDYATANGSAGGADYTPASGTLTFLPGQVSHTVDVATLEDTLDENDETFTVTLSLPVNATIADGGATGTIVDNDAPPTVSIGDAAAVSEGGTAQFPVTLSTASAKTVTVGYSTVHGTTSAADFTGALTGTVTFNPGQTSKQIDVATSDDAVDEAGETFTVTLESSPLNATLGSSTGSGAITDNDGPAISIANVTVDEGAGNADFTVSLSAPSPEAISVRYTTANGTAVAGSDYTAVTTPATLTIPANTPSGTISIPVTNDGTDELDETFLVNLSAPTNATIADSEGQATITDNDGPTISVTDVIPAESVGSTVFTVALSASSPQTVTVQYATADGTASSPVDYTALATQTLTFLPGQTSKQVPVTILEDPIDEANETFFLNLSTPTNAFFGDNQGQATITDNDGPAISIADATVTEGNAGTATATFEVTLSAPSPQTVSVGYATANGAATAGPDYTTTSSPPPVTFAPGETTKTITVPVQGDTLNEADETFFVNLSGATNASLGDAQGLGTITNDDALPSLSISDAVAVTEGHSGIGSCVPPLPPPTSSQCASFTVTLSAVSGRAVTVGFATAPGSAASNVDFNGTAGTLTFAAGETVKTILVRIRGDVLAEANETFFVNLSSETNAVVDDGQGEGTITDDDPLPSLSIDDVTSANESGSLRFTVTMSPSSGQTVTVNAATTGGAATQGVDYEASASLLSFAPGETSKTFDVPLRQDTLDEDPESFTATLSNPSAAAIADGTGVGTITDDDAPPSVSIGPAPAVNEGAIAVFPVTLSGPSGKQVTVQYSTANGSAVAPGDFNSATNQTVTFAAGETTKQIQVQTNDDTFDEADESFTVTLQNPTNATVGTGAGTGTIVDTDEPSQVSIGNAPAVTEGGAAAFTVTLTPASGRTVTVNYSTANGTAVTPADYTGVANGTVTFVPGDTTETISIPTASDTLDEAVETFTVTLTALTNATLGTANGTGTINDDPNDLPPTVSIANAAAVTEGGTASFPVTLSAASGQTVTVSYSTANGTAVTPADYTGVANGTVTFVPGDTIETISIPTASDTLDEAVETFTVTLTALTNATLGTANGTGTINDDPNDLPPTVSIANAAAVTEGGTASFPVTLSAASGRTVTVNYAVTHTTSAAADFTSPLTGTVTFAPGDPLTKQINLVTNDDSLDEADSETFSVALSAPVNATLGTPSSGTGVINDNDAVPTLSIGDTTVLDDNATTPARDGEGDSGQGTCAAAPFSQCAVFTVTLSAASGLSVTVNFTTADGTATSGDYVTTSSSLTFAPGETSKTVRIPVRGDPNDEPNETFTVTLSVTPTSNATIADGLGTATIFDDDDLPALSVTGAMDIEGNPDESRVVVALQPASEQSTPVTVNFATTGGTAVAGVDFVGIPPAALPCSGPAGAPVCTLEFAPGQTSKAITIDLIDDTLDEPDETFTVSLSGEQGAIVMNGNDRSGIVTITDNDDPPSITIGDASVTEGNGGTVNAGFPVTLSAASGKPVTVAYATSNGSAVAPTDYASSSGTLTFAPGETSKTVGVLVNGDGTIEADETFGVALSAPVDATIGDGTAKGTIVNDDNPPPPPPPPPLPEPPPPPPPPAPPTPPAPPDPTTTTTTTSTSTTSTTTTVPVPTLKGMVISAAPIELLDDLAPVGITCPKRAKGTCVGTVLVQGQARTLSIVNGRPTAKAVTLGRESFAIPRGKTEKVLVALSRRAVKAVKRVGRLRVTVVVTARDSAGKRTTKPVKRQVWLKAPKSKRTSSSSKR
jgi:Calx-beta domain